MLPTLFLVFLVGVMAQVVLLIGSMAAMILDSSRARQFDERFKKYSLWVWIVDSVSIAMVIMVRTV